MELKFPPRSGRHSEQVGIQRVLLEIHECYWLNIIIRCCGSTRKCPLFLMLLFIVWTQLSKLQAWFKTKIARPEVQLPLYYIQFEIAQFNSQKTRPTRFWSVPLYFEPVAGPGMSISESRNAFTSHFENMSTWCDCIMWLVVLFYCLILIVLEKDAI